MAFKNLATKRLQETENSPLLRVVALSLRPYFTFRFGAGDFSRPAN